MGYVINVSPAPSRGLCVISVVLRERLASYQSHTSRPPSLGGEAAAGAGGAGGARGGGADAVPGRPAPGPEEDQPRCWRAQGKLTPPNVGRSRKPLVDGVSSRSNRRGGRVACVDRNGTRPRRQRPPAVLGGLGQPMGGLGALRRCREEAGPAAGPRVCAQSVLWRRSRHLLEWGGKPPRIRAVRASATPLCS